MTFRAAFFCGLILIVSVFGLAAASTSSAAVSTCVFTPAAAGSNGTMLLLADCTTDVPITVPDTVTLDGNGHTITALDPTGGHFVGAVVTNATPGSTIHVTNLTIVGQFGADVCDPGANRLRGILFSGASGTITNNQLFRIRQGPSSGCQEGNAIEVRNFPGEETMSSAERVDVTIADNVVENYQKTGVLVNGLVDAIVGRNVIRGDGPSTVIAQNGVQIGFGATALVSANSISGNNYTPTSFFACGIIVAEADGVDRKQQDNLFPPNGAPDANEKDTCGFSKGGNYEPFGN